MERIDMTNPTTTPAVTTTYSIHTHGGRIIVRHEDGSVVYSEPSTLTINASTNSDAVFGLVGEHIPGRIVAIEHDKDEILVIIAKPYTTHDVCRYSDGQVIGIANLTADQFAAYESQAQQPEGLIRLSALPHDFYELDDEFQDAHEDTTVYLD